MVFQANKYRRDDLFPFFIEKGTGYIGHTREVNISAGGTEVFLGFETTSADKQVVFTSRNVRYNGAKCQITFLEDAVYTNEVIFSGNFSLMELNRNNPVTPTMLFFNDVPNIDITNEGNIMDRFVLFEGDGAQVDVQTPFGFFLLKPSTRHLIKFENLSATFDLEVQLTATWFEFLRTDSI